MKNSAPAASSSPKLFAPCLPRSAPASPRASEIGARILSAGSGRVSLDRDGRTIRTADGTRSAHYEHTIVITHGAPILLTAA